MFGISLIWIHSRLSRCNTARGSCTGLVTVGPTELFCSQFVLFHTMEYVRSYNIFVNVCVRYEGTKC